MTFLEICEVGDRARVGDPVWTLEQVEEADLGIRWAMRPSLLAKLILRLPHVARLGHMQWPAVH